MYKSKHTGETIDKNIDLMQYVTNPNLLDNPYFVNPVNQRGQTEYTGNAYGIDRWYVRTATKLTLEDDGAVFAINDTAAVNARLLMQSVENRKALAGKTVTFSALVSEVDPAGQSVYLGLGYASSASGITKIYDSVGTPSFTTPGLYYRTCTLPETLDGTMLKVVVGFNNGTPNAGSFKIVAAKLELGSRQTLAHQDEDGSWVLNEIPNYADELAKCQRHQLVLGSADGIASAGTAVVWSSGVVYATCPIPVSMRATPAVSFDGKVSFATDAHVDLSNPRTAILSATTVKFATTAASTIAAGTIGVVEMAKEAKIIFDANP